MLFSTDKISTTVLFMPSGDSTLLVRSDADIREDIESELAWSPFVDANEVTVSVENGVATLTGTVDTWAEYNAARENAYEGGAASVITKLEVDGSA